jgi:hypothetical protein
MVKSSGAVSYLKTYLMSTITETIYSLITKKSAMAENIMNFKRNHSTNYSDMLHELARERSDWGLATPPTTSTWIRDSLYDTQPLTCLNKGGPSKTSWQRTKTDNMLESLGWAASIVTTDWLTVLTVPLAVHTGTWHHRPTDLTHCPTNIPHWDTQEHTLCGL